LTFDLGTISTIQGLALWNSRSSNAINGFQLFADNDNNFNNGGTLLETFMASRSRSNQISAQTFSFTPTSTQFVHLDITSNHGDPNVLEAGEVAFEQSATPVSFEFGPIPVIIGIVAVGGINYFRNKK